MNFELEEQPSAEISLSNISARCKECEDYLTNSQWFQYTFLFKIIYQFSLNKSADIPDNLMKSIMTMQKTATEGILKNLEISTVFEDFQTWMSRLSDVVQDRKRLWDIIHTEANTAIRVTLRQSHEIATAYFTPTMLFEFGINSFLKSSVCDFTNIANEEALIDIFYGLAGFVRACNLDSSYETNTKEYLDFIQLVLDKFTELPDFDAQRFVWLVEAISSNLHVPDDSLKEMCLETIQKFADSENVRTLQKLHKLCAFSTSPFMQNFQLLKKLINSTFVDLIEEQRNFIRRYIFSCFATLVFDTETADNAPSMPVQCWCLYVSNLAAKLADRPELPSLIMIDLLEDSLVLFEGFYGDVQPTEAKAADLRADIIAIAETISRYYPGEPSDETKKRIWYLLFIVSFSGASEEEIAGIRQIESPKPNAIFLGIEHTATDFMNYQLALGVFSSKFASESNDFPQMASFIRANYSK